VVDEWEVVVKSCELLLGGHGLVEQGGKLQGCLECGLAGWGRVGLV